ncbi:helix-turn-helix domain-containing protein [Proteiniclasticum sp. C24MP]|uniref:helix-turn-helix domain-containing protein n=1 Tax=Proteiniclasticum sp. C24MP TaxID=3374101 RepID=UPI00375484DA
MSEKSVINNIELSTLSEFCHEPSKDVFTGNQHLILFNMNSSLILFVNNEQLELGLGDIVFVKPHSNFQIRSSISEETEKSSIVIQFREQYWSDLIRKTPELNTIYETNSEEDLILLKSPKATWQGLYSVVFMLFTEYTEENVCRPAAVEALFITTMVHMNRTVYFQKLRTRQKKDNEMLIKDMTYYVFEHYAEKISLDDLSGVFNISKSKITHLFKEKHNMSFYQVVLQRRLIHAKNSILSGMNISEVAFQCGFSEYTSFYKAFRKTFGMSPKSMQKQYKGKIKTPEPF